MKKIIPTLLFMFFLTTSSKAQSNLEFSRVVKAKYGYTLTTPVNSSIVVPAGKVLKVTSATVGPTGGSNTLGSTIATIDEQVVAFAYTERSNTYQALMRETTMIPLPLWLPAGTYTIYCGSGLGAGSFSFSGIEFNIVP